MTGAKSDEGTTIGLFQVSPYQDQGILRRQRGLNVIHCLHGFVSPSQAGYCSHPMVPSSRWLPRILSDPVQPVAGVAGPGRLSSAIRQEHQSIRCFSKRLSVPSRDSCCSPKTVAGSCGPWPGVALMALWGSSHAAFPVTDLHLHTQTFWAEPAKAKPTGSVQCLLRSGCFSVAGCCGCCGPRLLVPISNLGFEVKLHVSLFTSILPVLNVNTNPETSYRAPDFDLPWTWNAISRRSSRESSSPAPPTPLIVAFTRL